MIAMSKLVFTDKELITATVASLKKWENVSKGKEYYGEECGFCTLILEYEAKSQTEVELCYKCPVRDICTENTVFWSEINYNPRKRIDPIKFKYQQRRIQKNIDWLKDYLMKVRARTITVQCQMCEAGEYKSLDSLKEHLEKEHKLTEDDLIQYGSDFSDDIELLIDKEKRTRARLRE